MFSIACFFCKGTRKTIYHAITCLTVPKLSYLGEKSVKFAFQFHINYDLNLETAEFLVLGLCNVGETLFNARH